MPIARSTTPRDTNHPPETLNDHLDRRLLTYMAAAGAAGVSVLAMAQPAHAKVIFTPANKSIIFDGMHIDLNNDGIPDFGFLSYGIGNFGSDVIFPIKFNKMFNGANPQPAGVSVGPGGVFHGGRAQMLNFCSCSGSPGIGGAWIGIQNEYMGFEFNIKGAAHFGWARFSVTDTGAVTLTGYAYETVSLKPIVTGDTGSGDKDSVNPVDPAAAAPKLQPASLGRLALGVRGGPARRESE